MSTRVSRIFDAGIIFLAVAATVQVVIQWRTSHTMPKIYSQRPLPVGQALDVPVTDDATNETRSLVDVGAGTCRYVIVATPTCPFCRALSASWTITAGHDHNRQLMPGGWTALWVVADSLPAGSKLFSSQFPAAAFHTPIGFRMIDRVGARGVPFHVVVDRNGQIVSGGLGGELMPRSAFTSDCRVVGDFDVPGFTPRSASMEQ